MQNTHMAYRGWSALVATLVLLTGCASKAPQGYGASKSTASLAQAQLMAAEQSTQVDTEGAYLGLIAQMQQAGHWYAALAHTEAFEQEHGTSHSVQLLRADALRNTQQDKAAKQLYLALLTTSQASRAYRGIGLLEASHANYDAAIVAFEQARKINPIDASTLSDMGYAYMRSGQLEQAKLPVMQAAQLAPNSARIQMNLALYWLASGEEALGGQVLQKLQPPQAPAGGALITPDVLTNLREQVLEVQSAVAARKALAQTQSSEHNGSLNAALAQ